MPPVTTPFPPAVEPQRLEPLTGPLDLHTVHPITLAMFVRLCAAGARLQRRASAAVSQVPRTHHAARPALALVYQFRADPPTAAEHSRCPTRCAVLCCAAVATTIGPGLLPCSTRCPVGLKHCDRVLSLNCGWHD